MQQGSHYGMELVLDLEGCVGESLSRPGLSEFLIQICAAIDMRRHGEPMFWEDTSEIPHLHGISAVQFIETSTIVCHPLPMLGKVFINIFSCKEFDVSTATFICQKHFGGVVGKQTIIARG